MTKLSREAEEINHLKGYIKAIENKSAQQKARIEELEEALKVYAEPFHWVSSEGPALVLSQEYSNYPKMFPGYIARKALSKKSGGEKKEEE